MKKICYCNHCGNQNPSDLKTCQYCNKTIKDKSILLIDYLLDETKDDIEGRAKDKLFSKIEYLIKKYLYGIVFSVTFISAVVVNIAIRTENSDRIVTDFPVVVSEKYQSQEDLIKSLEEYMKSGNVNAIYSLLYQYNYPKEAASLGIDATTSALFSHTKNNAFREGEFLEYIPEDNWESTSRFCKERETITGYACKRYIDVTNSKHKFYDTNILSTFYSYTVENEHYQRGEKVFMGKDDFDIFIVEADGNYYLADIFDNHFDPNIEAVKGDISKLDYQTQMDLYVGKPSEE